MAVHRAEPARPHERTDRAGATETPLGIICGGGSLPLAVADAVSGSGRKVVLFPLIGWADPECVERYPHHWIHIGQFGRFCRLARDGRLPRPRFHRHAGAAVAVDNCRLDWATVRLLPRIVRAFRGGDDHLLSGIGGLFEDHGFRLLGAHEVAPEILMPEGALGKLAPTAARSRRYRRGTGVLAATGPSMSDRRRSSPTAMCSRWRQPKAPTRCWRGSRSCAATAAFASPAGVGVLVKAPKPARTRRFDLPTIGPPTIEGAARAGLAGVAIVAGAAIVAEPAAGR